ncbi:MAG: NAD-binding protein [Anaerolineae bacterium]|nr:NAD-binding protein [Anaerolineae bacterium]MCX8068049.1 NAD-binding protein [Anaerolineae bacterium]MDW7992142.1 NAD-binding protein [Anaerolineae bacterium]
MARRSLGPAGSYLRPPWRRTLQAHLRDLRLLLREFRFTLLAFALLLLVGTLVLRLTYDVERLGWLEALDTTLKLLFFETTHDYPHAPPAQVVFVLWPLLGLALVVNGVVQFWTALFNRRERRDIWEAAVASTYRLHVIVCGLGRVGYRVILHLLQMGYEVVGVERNPDAPFLTAVRQKRVPVVIGNARQREVLEKAGVRAASALIAATEDDMTNLGIALTARDLNPGLQVVLRMFDDQLADDLRKSFGFAAFSASALAAPAFAAAATRAAVEHSVFLNGVLLNLSRLTVAPNSPLAGKTVGEVEQELDLSVLLHSGPGGIDFHPPDDLVLKGGDQIVVFAPLEALVNLERMNQETEETCAPEGRGIRKALNRLRRRSDRK